MGWNDSRLQFEHLNDSPRLEMDSKMMSQVWVPDVYFRNEKEAAFHDVTVPNKFMHLHPKGNIEYSMRLSLTLSCRMLLQKYPLDTQRCPMLIQSYTYTTENVMFYWQEGPGVAGPISYDNEIALGTELPQFSIVENITESCNGTMDVESPKFACIKAYFTLKRDIGYYIIQIYVPGVLIVGLSWVSFWLDLEAIPARVSLGVLTVLTLNTHGSHIQSQLPKVSYIKAIDVWSVSSLIFAFSGVLHQGYRCVVSYIKAIDVWSVSSLIFVFSALLEFAYVNVLTRRGDKELRATQVFRVPAEFGNKDGVGEVNGNPPRQIKIGGPSPSRIRARKIDKISRLVFPGLFLVFNVCYWGFYIYM
ncbi:glycine receptor subunit alpha-1 [Plakobranchus ocellatus]|uniref:Glycine receptor subunit alpha-1 n=1 Tax=Plakobranchus ocellatus TaxID=259542 RepID=A0AAV3XH12_9GAST|nr:glycine receptor subunit alpha-1 [Plakobranchus ocellatus]